MHITEEDSNLPLELQPNSRLINSYNLNLLIRLPLNPPTIFLFPTHHTHPILQLVKEDWNL